MEKKIQIYTHGESFTNATKIIAWLELICSVIMTLVYWFKDIPKDLKPIYHTLSINFLVAGIIIFVLLMTIHYMSQNILNIAKGLNNNHH